MITIKENNLNLCTLSNWDVKGRTVVQLEYTDANVPVYNKIFDNGTEIVLYPEEGKDRVAYGVFYNTDPNNSNSKYIYVDTFESVAMAAKYVNDVLLDKLGYELGLVEKLPNAETSHKTEKLNIREKQLNKGRYWVTDDNYIPLSNQPNNGYTKIQAIQRAQREAEQTVKLLGKRFGLTMQDAVKDYHIMDNNGNICHDLDSAI